MSKRDRHFALGLVVTVRSGAKPAGWGDEPFDEEVPVRRSITEVASTEKDYPHGSFEVGGWFWDPSDIFIGYGDN